jgi:hypothetical protein
MVCKDVAKRHPFPGHVDLGALRDPGFHTVRLSAVPGLIRARIIMILLKCIVEPGYCRRKIGVNY